MTQQNAPHPDNTRDAELDMDGLGDADLEKVVGGLNPQPLPPRELFQLFRPSFFRVLPSLSLPGLFRF